MKTAQAIIDDVKEHLARDGAAKIAGRRKVIARLADARDKWPGLQWPLRSRELAIFTLDQGRMLKADRRLTLKVLVLGRHVADLEVFPKGERSPELRVRGAAKVKAAGLKWSGSAKDGKVLRDLIAEWHRGDPGSAELQVQLQLWERLLGPKSKKPELENLQPVLPLGFPTELATVVGRTGKVATGNMDILARTGRGRGGGQFVVLELKGPTARSKVAEAFEQAIGYAAALTFEANGFRSDRTDPELVHYRRLFSSDRGGRPPDYAGKPLVANAVVVLPTSLAAAAEQALTALRLEPDTPKALGRTMRVGALLYDASRVENDGRNEWRLGDLRWLEHAGSWRP